MHSYYFDIQPQQQQQQQYSAPPGSGGYDPQRYPRQLNLDPLYYAYDARLDQQFPSSLSSASPLTQVGGGPGFQSGFQVGPAHDPLPPPLYPPPALGSSEHAIAYPPHQVSFYPVQAQYRAPSPPSSLWHAVDMPAAASNLVGPAPRSAPASALSKSSLSPLRIASPKHQLPDEDPPLPPASPGPLFGQVGDALPPMTQECQHLMQWQTPISAPSMALKPLARASSTRSPVKRAHSSDRKPVMACLFCRRRKIACGGPLNPDSENKTCIQCARRCLNCSYPAESHRGLRLTRNKSDFAPPAHEIKESHVTPILAAQPHLQ